MTDPLTEAREALSHLEQVAANQEANLSASERWRKDYPWAASSASSLEPLRKSIADHRRWVEALRAALARLDSQPEPADMTPEPDEETLNRMVEAAYKHVPLDLTFRIDVHEVLRAAIAEMGRGG